MRTRRIGSLEVSVIGLGTNNFGTEFFGHACDQQAATQIVDAALDMGVNFFDTAEEYSTRSRWGVGRSEEFLGIALGNRRNHVVIASKFMIPEQLAQSGPGGRTRIMEAVEGSLKRLGTDHIDLYQQHFPDPTAPMDEILEALDRLVKDGKVVEIGNSNFSGEMIDEADAIARQRGFKRFASAQNQYNLLDKPVQEGVIEACGGHGLMLLPYYPLSGGLLTGKYRKGVTNPEGTRFQDNTAITDYLRARQLNDDRIDKVEKLTLFAEERGHTILELAISWLASQPIVASVIAGATKPEQIRSNAAAADWDLTEEDFRRVAEILG